MEQKDEEKAADPDEKSRVAAGAGDNHPPQLTQEVGCTICNSPIWRGRCLGCGASDC